MRLPSRRGLDAERVTACRLLSPVAGQVHSSTGVRKHHLELPGEGGCRRGQDHARSPRTLPQSIREDSLHAQPAQLIRGLHRGGLRRGGLHRFGGLGGGCGSVVAGGATGSEQQEHQYPHTYQSGASYHPAFSSSGARERYEAAIRKRVRVRPPPRGTAPGASASRLLWPGRSRPGAAGAVGFFGGGDPILLIHRPAAVRLLHLGLGHVNPADPVGLADVHPRLPAVCSARVLARSGVTGSSGSRTSTPPCLCTRYLLIAVDLAPSRCLGYRRRRSGTRGRSKGLRPPRQITLKTPVVHPDYITSRCAGSPTVRADSEHLGTTG